MIWLTCKGNLSLVFSQMVSKSRALYQKKILPFRTLADILSHNIARHGVFLNADFEGLASHMALDIVAQAQKHFPPENSLVASFFHTHNLDSVLQLPSPEMYGGIDPTGGYRVPFLGKAVRRDYERLSLEGHLERVEMA